MHSIQWAGDALKFSYAVPFWWEATCYTFFNLSYFSVRTWSYTNFQIIFTFLKHFHYIVFFYIHYSLNHKSLRLNFIFNIMRCAFKRDTWNALPILLSVFSQHSCHLLWSAHFSVNNNYSPANMWRIFKLIDRFCMNHGSCIWPRSSMFLSPNFPILIIRPPP